MWSLGSSSSLLWPILALVGLYGLRYLLFAGLAFAIADPRPGRGWGRPHEAVPARFDAARHVRRELRQSLLSLLIFGLVNAAVIGFGWIHASQLYRRLDAYPAWWFWLSVLLLLLLHDSLFYWLHRAMHSRLLYARVHRVHHQSVYPTSFAAYSFHPWEALGEALIVIGLIFLIPVHPLALLLFQTISTAYNVYGHCGREFFPPGMATHGLGRWVNTSSLHAQHHLRGRGNYGLYLCVWDRLLGTLDQAQPPRR